MTTLFCDEVYVCMCAATNTFIISFILLSVHMYIVLNTYKSNSTLMCLNTVPVQTGTWNSSNNKSCLYYIHTLHVLCSSRSLCAQSELLRKFFLLLLQPISELVQSTALHAVFVVLVVIFLLLKVRLACVRLPLSALAITTTTLFPLVALFLPAAESVSVSRLPQAAGGDGVVGLSVPEEAADLPPAEEPAVHKLDALLGGVGGGELHHDDAADVLAEESYLLHHPALLALLRYVHLDEMDGQLRRRSEREESSTGQSI